MSATISPLPPAAQPTDDRSTFNTKEFAHRAARDGEILPRRADHQARDDRQRHRHAQHDREPPALVVAQLDEAAERSIHLSSPFPAVPDTDEKVDELYITRTWQFLPGDILRNR